MEMLLTGIPITANEAVEYGLINRAVPADKLRDEVAELARTISNASAFTVALGKSAFYRQREMDIPTAYEMAEKVMVENLLAADAQEGITAFLEKRTPHWTT
jgi:enoyl-CoA hydratase/carnithine racemase